MARSAPFACRVASIRPCAQREVRRKSHVSFAHMRLSLDAMGAFEGCWELSTISDNARSAPSESSAREKARFARRAFYSSSAP